MKHSITILALIGILTAPLGQAVELSEKDSGKIARVVGFLLSQTHFKRTPLNDDISAMFLRKYMESLDYSRMVFLQTDYVEFEAKYGTLLDNLTSAATSRRPSRFTSDTSPDSRQRTAGWTKSSGGTLTSPSTNRSPRTAPRPTGRRPRSRRATCGANASNTRCLAPASANDAASRP